MPLDRPRSSHSANLSDGAMRERVKVMSPGERVQLALELGAAGRRLAEAAKQARAKTPRSDGNGAGS